MRLIDADEFIKALHEEWDEVLVWDESGEATADEIESLVNEAPTIDQWHYPSKGEYPDDNEIVLLSIKGTVWKRMEFGQWNGQFFTANDSDYLVSEIRAWMPLPPPPQEEV